VRKSVQIARYVIFDFFAAATSWALFFLYRKLLLEPVYFGTRFPLNLDLRFYLGVVIIPVFWIVLYYLSGYYKDPFRKLRLNELGQTFFISLIGVTILFFSLILDDIIVSYKNYYTSFLVLFSIHFILTYIPRSIITTTTTRKIHRGIIGFKTLLVGSNERAVEIYKDITDRKNISGNRVIGFISVHEKNHTQLAEHIPQLGNLDNLTEVAENNQIEEVIIALESSEHDEINRIIYLLNKCNVIIKAIPDLHDILTGTVKINTIYRTPLIQISRDLMPVWQVNLKRTIDIIISMIVLIVFSPLIIFLVIGVKTSSKGPVLYKQERIGKNGKPFILYKFRSMYANAEKNGPELTRKDDARLTTFGKFMRNRKLDEIPNFINVLAGEMSLVGPRPERRYYIEQIVEKAPHFIHLLKVKPGITSWGQVKYGYAENVNEMIKRLDYDLLYIQNMSLLVDFQIIIYTFLTIFGSKNV
jgi:exopolysaccharide biosynthesis polyprenyl glycosylphosphotransferase